MLMLQARPYMISSSHGNCRLIAGWREVEGSDGSSWGGRDLGTGGKVWMVWGMVMDARVEEEVDTAG